MKWCVTYSIHTQTVSQSHHILYHFWFLKDRTSRYQARVDIHELHTKSYFLRTGSARHFSYSLSIAYRERGRHTLYTSTLKKVKNVFSYFSDVHSLIKSCNILSILFFPQYILLQSLFSFCMRKESFQVPWLKSSHSSLQVSLFKGMLGDCHPNTFPGIGKELQNAAELDGMGCSKNCTVLTCRDSSVQHYLGNFMDLSQESLWTTKVTNYFSTPAYLGKYRWGRLQFP